MHFDSHSSADYHGCNRARIINLSNLVPRIRRGYRTSPPAADSGGSRKTALRASATTRGLVGFVDWGATRHRHSGLHICVGKYAAKNRSMKIQPRPGPQSVNAIHNSLTEGRRVDMTLYGGTVPLPDMQLGTCHWMEDSLRNL